MNSQRVNNINMRAQSKTVEKLSSGFKVNRAADDAAGLSISEKMRKQIRGLTQASANAQDGISMVQIADGALTEVHEMLQRGNELMVKAANGTLSDNDRDYINMEVQQLKTAIDQVATTTKFNELYLFPDNGYSPTMASSATFNKYEIEIGGGGVTSVTHTAAESDIELDDSVINTGNALAKKVAQEYVPNAVKQILESFPSIKSKIDAYGADNSKLKLDLEIKSDDGEGSRLAYVSGTFYMVTPGGSGSPYQEFASFSLTVDKDDYSSSHVTGNNAVKLSELESTLAHEIMHAAMNVATPSGMYPNSSIEDYPLWFKEGTAQLTGGGFPTNWNEGLRNSVLSAADADKNDKVWEYLQKYKIRDNIYTSDENKLIPEPDKNNRVYGDGYLAAAYMGYLANGGTGAVTGASIAEGMDKIFAQITSNPTASFKDNVNTVLTAAGAGVDYDQIIDGINGAETDTGRKDKVIAFVRGLVEATGSSGAGSVIASSLSATAQQVLGDATDLDKQPIWIDLPEKKSSGSSASNTQAALTVLAGSVVGIHAGADADMSNKITVKMFNMSSKALGLADIGLKKNEKTGSMDRYLSEDTATRAINSFATAIDLVSSVRSYYGAIQNRMEHTILNLDNVVENTTSSESAIRDTDMATEAGKSANNNILIQAGQQMMAQANKSNEGILTLMR